MEITSARNPLLQKIRKAVLTGRATDEGLVVAEGPHLLEEALAGRWRVARVVTTPEGRRKHADLLHRVDAEVVEVSERAFEATSGTEHSQQILALTHPPVWNWSDLTGKRALLMVLDVVQDPGNAGTIVRSAEAFGATGVVFLRGSAHVANGKLLRASAGSIFRMPFVEGVTAPEFLANARVSDLTCYALDARTEVHITSVELTVPIALIAGNEGRGVSAELLASAKPVAIPAQKVESLNAAVACAVALFAAQQQRSTA